MYNFQLWLSILSYKLEKNYLKKMTKITKITYRDQNN